ncbi:MAG: undecaprenyl diphosphate synthase family protein [Methanosarcinales archaeon]|nr:undecaprenyl diphosphate synthase family protein [Methanosarcinales archaeon]
MLYRFYERLLERDISRYPSPRCVAIVLSAGDLEGRGVATVRKLVDWSLAVGVECLAVHISQDTPDIRDRLAAELAHAPAEVCLHSGDQVLTLGAGGGLELVISLGFGGRREVTDAIRRLLKDVEEGRIGPEEISEDLIEKNLRFSQRPDLVIRAGGKQLSDFMIWQAAYSELYFTEVNWSSMRKIDFLRAVRDYQKRERRFGR